MISDGSHSEKIPISLKTEIPHKTPGFRLVVFLMTLLCIVSFGRIVTLANANEKFISAAVDKNNTKEISPSEIKKKIKDLKERIMAAKIAENEQTARQFQVTLGDLQDHTDKLRVIQGTYDRLLTALSKRSIMKQEGTLLRKKIDREQQIGIRQSPPFSLSFYDNVANQLTTAEQQTETANMAIKLAHSSFDNAEARLKEAEKNIRRLKEELGKAEERETQKLRWALEDAELERELAQANLDFQKINTENLSKALGFAMERRIIESDVRFHIDELFRESVIIIAFPQRDTHLDTQRPLEVRLLNSNKE